ncbi:TPA: hypothetical protein ACHFQG_004887 [Enterobacter hormaechei]
MKNQTSCEVFFLRIKLRIMHFITCATRNYWLPSIHRHTAHGGVMMSSSANRKMVALPRGVKIEPLYSECPKCGCDLTKLPVDFAVLPDTFDEVIIVKGRQRTRMEKMISVAAKKLSVRIKRFGQRLADKCLSMWK